MAPSPRRGRGTTTSSKEENEESPINIFNRSSKSFFFGAIGAKPHAHTTHHVLEKYTTNPPFDAGAIYVDGTLRQHERKEIDKTMGVSLFVAQE